MNTPLPPDHRATVSRCVTIETAHPRFTQRLSAHLRKALLVALGAGAGFLATPAGAETAYLLTADTRLVSVPLASPVGAQSAGVVLTGVLAGETLVAIDVRPQNQRVYALGVDPINNTATLYHLSPETGQAAVVGSVPGSIAFTTDGTTPVDFPDPALVKWDIDFNPAVDRLRVVAGSLNLRVNPNTGGPVDGDNGGAIGSVTGVNPDGPTNGQTTTVDGVAYTNNQPNNGSLTTLYTLDSTSNSLFIQNPANSGTQALVVPITLGGSSLDFSATNLGFDIAPGVNAASSGAAVTAGSAFAFLNDGGTTGVYAIDLVTGAATFRGGNINAVSLAVRPSGLSPAIAISDDGTALVRFDLQSPGTVTTQAVNTGSLAGGETLVGIAARPQTGQIYGLGVSATGNTATLYLVDPQTGDLTAVGAASQIEFTTDGATPVDFPDPAIFGFGIDFNPAADRLRVVTTSGLNFRVNPDTGASVDGDNGGAPGSVTGTNPDGAISGNGVTGVAATAYTNSYPQLAPNTVTTQFTLDAVSNTLLRQNPPNAGTQTSPLTIVLGVTTLDIGNETALDIPSSVSVGTAGAAAVGEGWFVSTVAGLTRLYRLDLATGVATNIGNVGAGITPLGGLIVHAAPVLRVDAPLNTQIYNNVIVDFGSQGVGSTATREFVVRNTGNQTLNFSSSLVSGTAGYAIAGTASGNVLPGGSATLVVEFEPTATGLATDTLHLVTNDAGQITFDIELTGVGVVTLGDDAATVAGSETRLYVLANDGLGENATISSVSDGLITIEGRTLVIPPGYSGTFTYTTLDGGATGQGSVTVTSVAPLVNPTIYTGLLTATTGGDIVGTAKVTITKNVATIALTGGTVKLSTKATLSLGGTGTVFTTLGNLTLTRNVDNTVSLSIAALGGEIGGTLPAVRPTAAAAKYHVALASLDPDFPGGGYAIFTVSTTGLVAITGLLPDGVAFSGASAVLENNTIPFYSIVTAAKPPGIVAGELTVANLTTTDITGELAWAKLPQLSTVKGVHLAGTSGTVTLTANGSLVTSVPTLPSGPGMLELSGGGLVTETNAVIVSAAGVPTVPTGSLRSWSSGVVKVRNIYLRNGLFTATVLVPAVSPTKPVAAKGIYLPKSDSAWGYFPGATVGGRIELTVP